jgi:peptidoglycan/LPS O-acetylase OafA/YrhL
VQIRRRHVSSALVGSLLAYATARASQPESITVHQTIWTTVATLLGGVYGWMCCVPQESTGRERSQERRAVNVRRIVPIARLACVLGAAVLLAILAPFPPSAMVEYH